jgi:hypothetical protein
METEIDRARGTHFLETVEGRTNQNTERRRPSEGDSLPGDHRGRDKSGGKKPDRARGTHFLETAEGGTSQDTEKKPTEGHSLPGDRGGGDKSRHGKELIERGALTSWR